FPRPSLLPSDRPAFPTRRSSDLLLFRFHALPIRRAAKDACRRDPVIPSGFEPETHSLEGCCSIQLSYGTISSSRAQSRTPVRNSDRKSTRLNSSHVSISYAVFCL